MFGVAIIFFFQLSTCVNLDFFWKYRKCQDNFISFYFSSGQERFRCYLESPFGLLGLLHISILILCVFFQFMFNAFIPSSKSSRVQYINLKYNSLLFNILDRFLSLKDFLYDIYWKSIHVFSSLFRSNNFIKSGSFVVHPPRIIGTK